MLELCEALKDYPLNSWSLMDAEGLLLQRSGPEVQDMETLGLFVRHQIKNARKIIDFGEFISYRFICAQGAAFMISKKNYIFIFQASTAFDVSQLKLPYQLNLKH